MSTDFKNFKLEGTVTGRTHSTSPNALLDIALSNTLILAKEPNPGLVNFNLEGTVSGRVSGQVQNESALPKSK